MKTPNLWQKLVGAFRKPDQQTHKKKTEYHAPDRSFLGFSGGGSIYRNKKGASKLRKRRKRIENRSRAINYTR